MINAEITILSPTLIGSGERIDFKYLFKKEGKYYIVDFEKTADLILASDDAGAYTDKILDKISRGQKDWQELWDDLNRKNLLFYYKNGIDEISSDMGKNIQDVMMYIGTLKQNGNSMDLMPYIPGSTIKGSLRNAIFYRQIKKISSEIKERSRYKNEFKEFFNVKGRKESIMKYIMVSDFFPMDSELKLGVGRIIRRNIYTSSEKGKFTPAVYISSGRFSGSIKLNRDFYSLSLSDQRLIIENFKQKLETDIFETETRESENSIVSNRLLNCLIRLLEDYTRDIDTTYPKDLQGKFNMLGEGNLYLGFGKGLKRNSAAEALPQYIAKEVFRFPRDRGSYPPSTMSLIKISESEYLPLGKAKIKEITGVGIK
ncbi:MAG: type III-A CRISPR-associated RAMP protein Csm5 [Thermoplasmataceae archaeon]